MKKLLIACAMAMSLVACTPVTLTDYLPGTSFGKTIQNPVGKRELASVELTYQTTARIFVACKKIRCTSAANLRKYQEYDKIAYAAIVAARPVVRNNPNISGLSAVLAARQAVSDYQNALGR